MSDTDFAGVAFAAGSVNGLRSWSVDPLGRLRGVSHPRIWRPGENESKCIIGLDHKEPIPETCGCGYWAYYRDEDRTHGGSITGVIEGYGVTQLGTKGFRTQKARVVALVLPDEKESSSHPRWDRWSDLMERNDGLSALVVVGGIVGGIIAAISSVGLFAEVSVLLGVAAVLLSALLFVGGFAGVRGWDHGHKHEFPSLYSLGCTSVPPSSGLSSERCALIRRNYPDIPTYPNVQAMLRKHPVDKAPEPQVPGPDDEGFWDDEEESEAYARGGFIQGSIQGSFSPSTLHLSPRGMHWTQP